MRRRKPSYLGIGAATIGAGTIAALVGAFLSSATLAHKAITSKYTYNEHVFPIVRAHCGRCHAGDGPTPMSLMTYKDAMPWAVSIREQVVNQAMPPWFADPLGPPVRGVHAIPASDLDILLTWAAGGTPEGNDAQAPPPVMMPATWRSGTPDATLQMPEAYALPVGTVDGVHEFTVPTSFTGEKWVKSVDLLPGTPSMTRSALIGVDGGPLLAAWVSGDDAIAAPNGHAFRVPAGARLRVTIRYRKHWQDELVEKSDRSTIGVYFTDPPLSGRGIENLAIAPAGATEQRAFAATLRGSARVLAFRPVLDRAYASIAVDAVSPDGRRTALLRLTAVRPQWQRRYWLVDPIELPKGTRIEVTAAPAPAEESAAPAPVDGPLQMVVDCVPL